MKKLLPILFILISFSGLAQLTEGKIKVLANGYAVNCAFYSKGTGKRPLIIAGHGTGQAGTNIASLYTDGLPALFKSGFVPPIDVIVAMPQATSYGINADWMPYILADLLVKFPDIDTNKIFITGFSAGGWMSLGSILNIDTTFAKKFAGIIPMSPATQDINKKNYSFFKVAKVPTWITVGSSDVSYPQQAQAATDSINKYSAGLATITYFPNGHCCWQPILKSDPFWNFIKNNSRKPIVAPPPVVIPPAPVKWINCMTTTYDSTGKIIGQIILYSDKTYTEN